MALILKAGLPPNEEGPNTVSAVLNQIEAVLPSIENNYNLKNLKYKVEFDQILKEMRQKENILFEAFGIKSGKTEQRVQALEDKIKQCKQIVVGLNNMSGPQVWRVIAPALRSKDAEENKFINYMQKYLEDTYQTVDFQTTIGQDLGEYVIDALNTAIKESSGDTYTKRQKLSSTRRFTGASFETMFP